jgi:ketosteroid isomerase-like protein
MMGDGTDEVLETERRRCAAMLTNDPAALEPFLDPRLHFSHATGIVDDKAGVLDNIAAGRVVYHSVEQSEQKVISLGDTAILTARVTTGVRVNGVEKELQNRVISVWVKSGDWRMIAYQSTPLAG